MTGRLCNLKASGKYMLSTTTKKSTCNKVLIARRVYASAILLIFIILAGCKSNPVSALIRPRQRAFVGPIEKNDDSPSPGVRRDDCPGIANADLLAKTSARTTAGSSVPRAQRGLDVPSAWPQQPQANTAAAPDQPKVDREAPGDRPTAFEAPLQVTSPPSLSIPILNEPGMADRLVSVNFDQVDIRMVLKTIGDITGINFVVDKSVAGPVTVISPTKIRLGKLYGMLESILDVQGYAAIPGDGLVKVVPKARAGKHSLLVRLGTDPAQIPQTDSIVTQIMPLTYADADEVSRIIQPFLGVDAQISTYPRTNSIVVTDTSSNIHHLSAIIGQLDVPGSKEDVTVIPLKYASAQVLSEQLSRIMDVTAPSSGQPLRAGPTAKTNKYKKILPDTRTNSIIVVANAEDTAKIRSLVERLDVQRPVGTNNVHVVYLQNAQSKEVAQSLTAALSDLRISGAIEAAQPVHVTADEGTNALIISASAQDFEVISGIIEKLDIVREQVLVEMQIMEVSEDSLKEIGIDWATLDQAIDDSVRFFGATGFGPRVDFASGNLEGLAIGAWRGAGSNRRIGTILHALKKQTGVNILSTPHILTSNHHTAKIIVGENRPFVTESRITETTDFITPTVIKTYEYKDVGITLEITPHISQGGLIRLEVNTEFTKLIEDVTTTSSDTPATAKRQAQTVISMLSGSTVVIGGLIRDDAVSVEKKVPLLGDIPGLGALFRFRRDKLEKTNLLIFITPHRLGSQKDLEDATERKRREMAPVLEDLQNKNGTE